MVTTSLQLCERARRPNRAMLIYDGLHYDALALEADGLLQAVRMTIASANAMSTTPFLCNVAKRRAQVPSLPDRQAMDVTSFEVGNSAVPSPCTIQSCNRCMSN